METHHYLLRWPSGRKNLLSAGNCFGSLEPNSDWKGFSPTTGAVLALNDDGRAGRPPRTILFLLSVLPFEFGRAAGGGEDGFCCSFFKIGAVTAPRGPIVSGA